MNQNYHRRLRQRWEGRNRRLKVTIAGLAVISLLATALQLVPSFATSTQVVSIIAAVASVGAAIWLNVKDYSLPAAHHEELYRQWSLLKEDLRELRSTVERLSGSNKSVSTDVIDKWSALDRYKSRIEMAEPDDPDRDVLQQCYEDENESRWGVRKYEDVLQAKQSGRAPNWPGLAAADIVPPAQPVSP